MGLGATSYNYLFLKNELSNNQRELMSLSNQKMALARDSSKISREYQEALNKKTTNKNIKPQVINLFIN